MMWKYKEQFVFAEIRHLPQDGELEFVQAILEGNKNLVRERNLTDFVDILNARTGCQENFNILLEIYNILIEIDSMAPLKRGLIQHILETPNMLTTHDSESWQELNQSINVQEILANILKNKDMAYAKDHFKEFFPLEKYAEELDRSMQNLEKLYNTDPDINQEFEDLEETKCESY